MPAVDRNFYPGVLSGNCAGSIVVLVELTQLFRPTLTIKLISRIGGINAGKAFQVLPAIGEFVGGGVNALMMNVCGHGVLAFIRQCKVSS